jgi:prepilin-type N-terminal cleavage/methylation domain-containing protein
MSIYLLKKIFSYFPENQEQKNQGFTLIELLVVVIIIGVLAAIAIPNLLGKVGRARETEAKNAIGTINHTQQAYHFEKQSFTPAAFTNADLAANNVLGVLISSKYYSFSTTAGNIASVTAKADAPNATQDDIRPYAGAVGFNQSNSVYSTILCQSNIVTNAAPTITAAVSPVCPPPDSTLVK